MCCTIYNLCRYCLSALFKSTILIALLNEPSDGECLMCGCILLQSVGPRYLSECFPNVTVSNLGTVNSLTLKLCTQLLSLKRSHMYLGHKLFFTLYIRHDISCNLLLINDCSLALKRSCCLYTRYLAVLMIKENDTGLASSRCKSCAC